MSARPAPVDPSRLRAHDPPDAPDPSPLRWWHNASCREIGGDLWFPETAGPAEPQVYAVCAACPVRVYCASWAITHHETHGIWAGLTPRPIRAATARVAAGEPLDQVVADALAQLSAGGPDMDYADLDDEADPSDSTPDRAEPVLGAWPADVDGPNTGWRAMGDAA